MSSEPNQTLGEFLRNERERRGITIEQVASATKINVRLLHSLEADHYVELPAKPFVRGFVTSYARFVGLSPRELLTRFGSFIDERAHERPNKDSGHSGYAFEKRDGEQSRTVLWFVMGGFMVVGGIVFVFLKPSMHHRHSSHIDKLKNSRASPSPAPAALASALPQLHTVVGPPVFPIATSPKASPSAVSSTESASSAPSTAPSAAGTANATPGTSTAPAPTPVPASSASPEAAAREIVTQIEPEPASDKDPLSSGVTLNREEIQHKVVFKAKEDVWVRYKVDGKPVMKFILRKDRVLVLRARKAILFQVSDPKNIAVNYNNQGAKILAAMKTYTPQQDGDPTLAFPFELAETIKDPFAGEQPLRGRPVPAPKASPSLSTSSQ